MIKVTVCRTEGRIRTVEIKGHSGYAKHGKDVVCAAVSAVAQTAILGLRHISLETVYEIDDNGYLKFDVPENADETIILRMDTVTETMLLGLKDIENGFRAFVKLEEIYTCL